MTRGFALALLCAAGCAGGGVRRERGAEDRAPRGVLRFLWARELTSFEYDGGGGIDVKPGDVPADYVPPCSETAGSKPCPEDAWTPAPPGPVPSVKSAPNDWRPEELAVAAVDAAHGRVYIGSASGRFRCLRASDGKTLWSVHTDGAVWSRPLLVARLGVVYFGSDDGNLYAVDASSGKVLWRHATKGTVRQKPAYEAGVVYFATSESRVYAVEARTGRWRWHYEREQPEGFTIHGESGVALARGRVYAGFADGVVVALDARTGDLLWLRSLAGTTGQYFDADGTPAYDARFDALYVSGYATGVYALDPDDGSIRWRIPVKAASAPRVHGGLVYVAAAGEGVLAADADGTVLWRQALDRGVPAAPVPWGTYLFVSASDKGLYAVDRRDGRLLVVFPPGGGISAEPAIAGGRLYVLSNRGHLYAAALD